MRLRLAIFALAVVAVSACDREERRFSETNRRSSDQCCISSDDSLLLHGSRLRPLRIIAYFLRAFRACDDEIGIALKDVFDGNSGRHVFHVSVDILGARYLDEHVYGVVELVGVVDGRFIPALHVPPLRSVPVALVLTR